MPVESRAILSLDHDEASRTLFVRFVDGDLYAYFDVPRAEYEAFVAADSKGRWFAQHVRDRFAYHQVR